MGLVEFLRQWERGRIAAGVGISILLHLALIILAIGIHLPTRTQLKRGEPLIVELPKADDSPPPGDGGAPESKPSPRPAPPAPRVQARPTPPAPKVVATAPQPATPARRSAPPAPRPEPTPPRQVASAPAAVQPAETGSVPAPQPAPAQPAPAEPSTQPLPADTPPQQSAPAESTPQPPAQRQVASLPPQPAGRAVPDALSALRRGGGGAGGHGAGHAGIEGEPIPLDSTDPRYSDYLDQVRRRIKEKWGYPCEKNEQTKVCEYRSTQLLIDFGIYKNGELAFVTLVRTSGHPIYDDYALNAIRLAAPFPPIPDSFSKTGVPIKVSFHYVLQTSLTAPAPFLK